jgi:hypothetical protein
MARDRRKWLRPPDRGPKYLLRNVHPRRMDVMLGDLGYRIPYGQTRDLLSPSARLDPSAVERSRLGGSIAQRLRQGVLMEVVAVVPIPPPQISVAEPSAISFPQRTKSLVVPDGGDLTESVQSVVADEDAELLRQMEEDEKALAEGEAAGLPVTVDPVKAAAVLNKVSGGCCGGKGRK